MEGIMYEIYLGPMSKNIVDGVTIFTEKNTIPIGLIASRRQVDHTGGYVNKWNTKTFTEYVKNRSPNVVVCRDHGGAGQGRMDDDGVDSLIEDAKCMDIIHIDPWKKLEIEDAIKYTVNMIIRCSSVNSSCFFEVGTEEAIFPMSVETLDYVLGAIKTEIPQLFSKIIYAVIQSGTSLKDGINTGAYEEARLLDMIRVCDKYGLLTKEHNGDYLSPEQVKHKLSLGLSSINIAPEVAHIETELVLKNISPEQTDKWLYLCIKDGQWSKWFSKGFDPASDKRKVLRLCGHYVFSNDKFNEIFDLNSISSDVSDGVSKFIMERMV
jgi:hypothetical protein